MKKIGVISIIIFLLVNAVFSQGIENEEKLFADLLNSDWNKSFFDSGTKNWEEQWFLDGQRASIKNMDDGMLFSAGPIAFDNASHAVLWTKQSFSGDIKIEYDYTRMDDITRAVNIIYIQAEGIGEEPYTKDITEWSHLRIIPRMSSYFNNMNLLHISYAAFNNRDEENKKDYVRARRYPVKPGEKFSTYTQLEGNYEDTGLFKPGITYHITIVKSDEKLFMKVEGEGKSNLFSWDTSKFEPVEEGRIGFRHMWTRCSKYANIKISER
jgi:hypothetical protein